MRLWELGSLAPRGETLREVALPFMQRPVRGDPRERAPRGARRAPRRSTSRRSSGPRARCRCAPGAAAGCRCTPPASARCCWPTRPEQLFREIVAAGLRRYTAHTIVAPGHLRRALTDVRRTGIAYAREELTVGSLSVASAVLDGEGDAVAALSVTLRSRRGDLRRLGPAVHTAAISISRALQERALLRDPDRSRPAARDREPRRAIAAVPSGDAAP